VTLSQSIAKSNSRDMLFQSTKLNRALIASYGGMSFRTNWYKQEEYYVIMEEFAFSFFSACDIM
jgi:hypothetical protein